MKKRIKDIFQPEIFAVPSDTPATVAMDIMREKNISCIVIIEDDRPVGIFTERDIVRCMVRQEHGFFDSSIAEIMTPHVHTITPDILLYEAFNVLAENLIRHLVVVDRDGKALGVLTQSDLLDHFEYDYLVRGCTVGQIMNKCTITADAYDTVYSAAKAMADEGLSFLIVCRQLQPLGVITERDIAGFAADGMDIRNTLTKDVMTTPVITIGIDQPAFMAAEKMHEFDIRHLVVINGFGKAIGVVTQTDLIRGLEGKFVESLRRVVKEQSAELAETSDRLAQKTLWLDAILNSSINFGIAVTDRDLQVTLFSHSAEFILGIPAGEVIGKDLRTIDGHRNIPFGRLEQAIAKIRDRDTFTFIMHRREDNLARTIQATLSGIYDKESLAGFLLIVEDITDKRIAEDSMHRLTYYDTLTGLPNRSMFYEKFRSELARSHRNNNPFCLILMDVDNFKRVNETLGHKTGDRLLRQIARRLDGLLRENDTIARMGNDEFCFILVSTTTADDARIAAQKIIRQLSPSFDLDGTAFAINFSLGAVMFPGHGEDEETLLRKADAAMNRAKVLGRKNMESNIVLFEG
ncbi:MAG: two-component hybrid sensor and regulator [uncultured bacterium]|nr:MAG: two-component hybrid sensor and regulator [uncultured bacterium]